MKPQICFRRSVVAVAVEAEQTAGSMEEDESSDDSSTTASEGDSHAITSIHGSLQAGDGIPILNENCQRLAIGQLCIDEIVHALTFLSPSDLLSVGLSSRAFRRLLQISDFALWAPQCTAMWSGKQQYCCVAAEFLKKTSDSARNFTATFPLVRQITRPFEPLSMGAFVNEFERISLSALGTQTTGCVKIEGISATKDYWWNLPIEQKIRALMDPGPNEGESTSWRFAFFMSLRDSKRQTLTTQELTDNTWRITFKQTLGLENLPVLFAGGSLHTALNNPLRYFLAQGGSVLNVGSLPALSVRRGSAQEEWKWIIENFFVRIESVDIPMPAYLKHLQQHTSMRPP
jgi:hypothetical protein